MGGNLLATLVAEKELEFECRGRIVRPLKPRVVEPKDLAELESQFFREGTIVCFAGEKGADIVDRLLTAAQKKDKKTIDQLGSKLRAMEVEGLARPNRAAIAAADHLVDVSYGSVSLGRGLAPSLVSVAVSHAVWNGGGLDLGKFTAADHVRDAKAAPVQVVVVLVKPRLSDLEKAVLRTVPKDIDEVHVQGPSLSWTPVAQAGLHTRFDDGSPMYQKVVEKTGQQQIQQQQENKQIQQQQQQHQQDDHQQQIQQQQQQDLNQANQQQQQQLQDAKQTNQQQQQQQQDAQTGQEQQQNQQDAQTEQHQEQEGSRSFLDDRQGVAFGPFDRGDYLRQLREMDFSTLDATQSAKALLRLREQLLRLGMP